jgi:hypothetical protein
MSSYAKEPSIYPSYINPNNHFRRRGFSGQLPMQYFAKRCDWGAYSNNDSVFSEQGTSDAMGSIKLRSSERHRHSCQLRDNTDKLILCAPNPDYERARVPQERSERGGAKAVENIVIIAVGGLVKSPLKPARGLSDIGRLQSE